MYDVFLSHASEDKDTFVRPLAKALADLGIKVWYDEFTLAPGMSLRTSIDDGLAKAKHCVVVISRAFFAKKWTQWELNGVIQRHVAAPGTALIIPIWYGVGSDEVAAYSPSLADIIAIRGDRPVPEIAAQLRGLIQPLPHVPSFDETVSRLEGLVHDVFVALSDALGSFAGISVLVSDADSFRVVAAAPHSGTYSREVRIPRSNSLVGMAARTKQMLVVHDTQLMPERFMSQDMVRSVVLVPASPPQVSMEIFVSVHSSEVGFFDGEKIFIVRIIAELLGEITAKSLLAPRAHG